MCSTKQKEWSKAARGKLVRSILSHYSNGDMCCACCGERQYLFLTLDHIEGGGTQERLALSNGKGGGRGVYLRLKREGYPVGYQVLCVNCQFGRALNHGVCPHRALAK
jgi:hypothetical protein